MTLARLAWAASFTLLACGSSEPPPAQSPEQAAPETPMAEAAPEQAATPAAADGSGDAAWEGEDTATSQKPSGEAATPAPDTKGEETRSIEVIADLIKAQRDPVRACYDKARKDLPTLQGDMVIHFVLNPEGKIKEINLNVERSTLKSPSVVDCAIKVIKGIKFPASSRGMDTTVNYPYNLNPR